MRRRPAPKPPPALVRAARAKPAGIVRACEARSAGLHPRAIAAMVEAGQLIRVSRGLYRLRGSAPAEPDLAIVARKVPTAVICLVSALSIHRLTTQIPRAVDLAVPRGFKDRLIEHPPVRFYRFGSDSLAAGIETFAVNGHDMRIYGAAKTVADCFKFRNRIGTDIAVEALRNYVRRRGARIDDLMAFARVNRVQAVMAPYLAALL
ncbi:MAG: transcriptional regulator [Phycisphaerales bacterium]|nr:transcriptional regulator [Phycisphaerales bacterium]